MLAELPVSDVCVFLFSIYKFLCFRDIMHNFHLKKLRIIRLPDVKSILFLVFFKY